MKSNVSITLANSLSEIEKVNDIIEQLAGRHVFSDKIKFDLILILEEFLTNIIKYSYEDNEAHEITVRFNIENNEIAVSIEDDGISFNPLTSPDPDINMPIEERKVGGLGIYIIRRITDQLRYARKNNRNIISFMKKLS